MTRGPTVLSLLHRRRTMLAVLLAAPVGSCALREESLIRNKAPRVSDLSRRARLQARPATASEPTHPGLHPLGLRSERDALLYVPASAYSSEAPRPLVISLHGAGGDSHHGIHLLRDQADAHGFVLLSPASLESTWDVIASDFGPDVAFIDQALERTFALCTIDRARLAIAGFSDGASYALSLGLPNGDLFTDILAFSPGFTAHPSATGKPRIFVSHGTHDQVLPIERCSRRIVPRLKAAGYAVDYREFNGPHTVPADMAAAAVQQVMRG